MPLSPRRPTTSYAPNRVPVVSGMVFEIWRVIIARRWVRRDDIKDQSLTGSLIVVQTEIVAKVTGKFQITLPKAIVDRCGIRVGDELDLRPSGESIHIDRRSAPDVTRRRQERLQHFDRATARQRARQTAGRIRPARSRGWTREELYVRGRTR